MIEASLLDKVIQLLAEMPGIGKRSAQRLAFFILSKPDSYAFQLAQSIRDLKENLRWCAKCFNICHTELCAICSQNGRDSHTICVVEDASGVTNIERSGSFRGFYHVLHGALSPVNGIGPDTLRLKELVERSADPDVKEIIIATNPTVEGEATAMYIADLLHGKNLRISRIGMGIPIGGSLDYCDEVTMTKAMENRRILEP